MAKRLALTTVVVALLILLATWLMRSRPDTSATPRPELGAQKELSAVKSTENRFDFSVFSEVFQFSAVLPESLDAEYVSANESIALTPAEVGEPDLNSAQIFIRHFEAADFQTLSTVNVLSRGQTKVGTHEAVSYEIEKKPAVASFTNQPEWRNQKHKLIDVRYAPSGWTSFFVFSYNPTFSQAQFDAFIASLRFHNDKNTLRSPLDRVSERVSKKTFGTLVGPANSPVQSERFSGFHTGWDFEIFAEELDSDVAVVAFCGGKIRLKETAAGYGGLVVQDCNIDSAPLTALYGHLKLGSVNVKVGGYRAPGDPIGLLGAEKSVETDGERKHLHFGLRKGSALNTRGYAAKLAELSGWLDPKDFL